MFPDKNLHQHFAALHDQQDHDDKLMLMRPILRFIKIRT